MKFFLLFLFAFLLSPLGAFAATTIASSTTSSLSVPVEEGDILLVNAKASIEGGTFGNVCLNLNMAGVLKDQTCGDDDNVSANMRYPYSAMFTTVPGATTTLITLASSFGSLEDIKIIAQVISADSGGGGSATTTPQDWELIMPYALLLYLFLGIFYVILELTKIGKKL